VARLKMVAKAGTGPDQARTPGLARLISSEGVSLVNSVRCGIRLPTYRAS
jgi:hypothetical protein